MNDEVIEEKAPEEFAEQFTGEAIFANVGAPVVPEEMEADEVVPVYKPCLSNGREVHWRTLEDSSIEAHDGAGHFATCPNWDRFQAYLDGKAGWPG